MQVLLKRSESGFETRCRVCGQGFVVFWERQTKMERAEAMRQIESTLKSHHHAKAGGGNLGERVHPTQGFLVPEWDGPIAYSGAAMLGSAPIWAL